MNYGHTFSAHCATRLDYILRQIEMALGIICDLSDWYACGDELI